jgi:extracellular factor (EF) 3-hydroxypalmitic acid methyl ester biosynthesis protein
MIGTNTALSAPPDTYPVVPVDPFDELTEQLLDPVTTAIAVQSLVADLDATRASRSTEEWRDYARAFQDHSLVKHLRQDAFTYRGFRKPRGYAGDAVLMDMVYGTGDGALVAKSSDLGKRIYAVAESTSIFTSTRDRVARLTAGIDGVCTQNPNAHIMSVACGHLREAANSDAVKSNRFGRFVGLDQDRRSLREIQKNHPNVECIAASISELIDDSVNPGRFDYIYSAGLYDYLDDEIGRRLLHALVGLLKPGGRIMIANFLPNLPTLGYMEAAMDWWMVYRPVEQFHALADNLPGAKFSRIVTDPLKHLNYLTIQF